MTSKTDTLKKTGPRLKRSSGWFAAGSSFKHALITLSDGAFKLFAYIALEADRQTGRLEATQTELARVLRKSRRAIGKYIAEIERTDICTVSSATNQHARNKFEILDEYWPYDRAPVADREKSTEEDAYVAAVRDTFLETGCTRGIFGANDAKAARSLRQRGVSLQLVQSALILGACRKYISWLNGGSSEPIATLAYFEPLVSEIEQHSLPEGYREHIQSKIRKMARLWQELKENGASKPLPKTETDFS